MRGNPSSLPVSLACHRGGGALNDGEFAGRPSNGVESAKDFPLFRSACLRKASKSGLASIETCFGMAAPNDLMEEVGVLQLSRCGPDESRDSLVSIAMPK